MVSPEERSIQRHGKQPSNELHPIDHPKKEWSDEELQLMMSFCIIDSNEPYGRVCKAHDSIYWGGFGTPYNTPRGWLTVLGQRGIHQRLKKAGYHYHNQAAKYLHKWAKGPYSKGDYLRTATREMMVNDITGVSWKLASMFLRNTRGIQYAVIDRYIRNYLIEKGYMEPRSGTKGYLAMEEMFIRIANDKGMAPYDLDMKIWEEMRVKHN